MDAIIVKPHRGSFTYACFKWILVCHREARRYAYQAELIDSLQHLNVRYLIGYLEVNEKSLPLLQYAMGALDGFLLENYFHKWCSTINEIVAFRQRAMWNSIARVFCRWKTYAKSTKHCRVAFLCVVMRRRKKRLRNTLETWWDQKRLLDLDSYYLYQLCKRHFRLFSLAASDLVYEHRTCRDASLCHVTRLLLQSITRWRAFKQHDQRDWRAVNMLNIRRYWRHWRGCSKYYRQVRCFAAHISRRDKKRRTHVCFGSWLALTLQRLRLKRCANHLIIATFQSRLVRVFRQWREAYMCSVSLRRDHLLRLQLQAREFEMNVIVFQRLSLERWKMTCFRAWRLLVRALNGSRKLYSTLSLCWYRNRLSRSFRHWIVSCSLATIAACVQKLWRGFAVRRLHFAYVARHIRWFSVRIGASLRFYNRELLFRMFSRWSNFCENRLMIYRGIAVNVNRQRSMNKWHYSASRSYHQEVYMHRAVAHRLLYVQTNAIRHLYRPIYLRQLRYRAAHYHIHRRVALVMKIWKRQCLFSIMMRRHEESQLRFCLAKWKRQASISAALHRRLEQCDVCTTSTWFKALRLWARQSRACRDTLSYSVTAQHLQLKRGLTCLRRFLVNYHSILVYYDTADSFYMQQLTLKYFPVLLRRLRHFASAAAYQHFKDVSARKMRHRLSVRRFFRYWRRWNCLRQRLHLCKRKLSLQDVFHRWMMVFYHKQRINRKVLQLRSKCITRLCRGIYLIWKLYAIRNRRIRRIKNIIHSNRDRRIKRDMLYKWREALEHKVIANVTHLLRRRSALRTKRSVFTIWFYAARKSQMLSWRSTAIVFQAWARLTRDNNITRRSLIESEVFYYKFNIVRVLRYMTHISAMQRYHRNAVQRSSALMLIWRARQALRRWIHRCWWLGYRVYRGRLRLLVPAGLTQNYLLVRGRTPLAYEANGKRYIRKWRRYHEIIEILCDIL